MPALTIYRKNVDSAVVDRGFHAGSPAGRIEPESGLDRCKVLRQEVPQVGLESERLRTHFLCVGGLLSIRVLVSAGQNLLMPCIETCVVSQLARTFLGLRERPVPLDELVQQPFLAK